MRSPVAMNRGAVLGNLVRPSIDKPHLLWSASEDPRLELKLPRQPLVIVVHESYEFTLGFSDPAIPGVLGSPVLVIAEIPQRERTGEAGDDLLVSRSITRRIIDDEYFEIFHRLLTDRLKQTLQQVRALVAGDDDAKQTHDTSGPQGATTGTQPESGPRCKGDAQGAPADGPAPRSGGT